MQTTQQTSTTGRSLKAIRLLVIKRGLAREDGIAAHYRRYATPVIQRIAATIIAGNYDGNW